MLKRDDLQIFAFCVGIATIFWCVNKLSGQFRRTDTLEVQYRLPSGLAFQTAPIKQLRITARGNGWDFFDTYQRPILIDVQPDDTLQSISNASLRETVNRIVGNDWDIISVTPEEINLHLESDTQKMVQVIIPTQIQLAKGYILSEPISPQPEKVLVKGAKTYLQQLQSIRTDTLKINNLNENNQQNINIAQDPILQYATEKITVTVKVEQFTEKTVFVPIVLKNAPVNVRIFPNKIRMTFNVPLSQYEKIQSTSFLLEADLEKDVKGSNIIPLSLQKSPTNIQNIKFSPKSVEYYFEK